MEVLGITTSEVGVAVARERARQAGLGDRVGFDQRDGTATGYSDASFDRILGAESSHLMRAKSASSPRRPACSDPVAASCSAT